MQIPVPLRLATALLPLAASAPFGSLVAQTVSPVITEYKAKASGRFALINNTTEPMMVVIEPRSFSIGPDGHGTYRPLDPSIRVELSTMSIQLQPLQTYYVFYKATAATFPSWFTIYSTFNVSRKNASLSVRIQLPHTVYLYQKEPLRKDNVHITRVVYSPATHKLICDLENTGPALGRVQQVQVTGPHGSNASLPGFPLLPGASRHLIVDWKQDDAPQVFSLNFERFTMKPPITLEAATAPSVPSVPAKVDPETVRPPAPAGS